METNHTAGGWVNALGFSTPDATLRGFLPRSVSDPCRQRAFLDHHHAGRPARKGRTMIHPEQMAGEVFLGNFTPRDLANVGWKSKRTGVLAYQRDGSPYPFQTEYGVLPVFVAADELTMAGVPLTIED